jgi:hypothetical protein
MKTAGREDPNHGFAWPRNRAHGAVGQNSSRSVKWAEKQEKFQPTGTCFFLTSPFIELIRHLPGGPVGVCYPDRECACIWRGAYDDAMRRGFRAVWKGHLPKKCFVTWSVAIAFLMIANVAVAMAQTGTSWPEADKLFHSDPRWLGGDAAFSTDLGDGRVLWMFGDSFVAKEAAAARRQSAFIRNSVAIETGYDPSRASIKFYTATKHGKPTDFALSEGASWFWPLHGIRLGDHLLLFYMRMASDTSKNSLGFQSIGWNAFIVENPDGEPSQWKLRKLDGPETQGKMLVGMSLIRDGENLYAFVLDNSKLNAYLLRWPVVDAAAGRLSSPLWWCGAGEGWQPSAAHRQVVIQDAGTEFSVQRDPLSAGFIHVKSQGFGATTIVLRIAPRLEGPWSDPQQLYRPPESDYPQAFVYGGKSHPELAGADLVITYTANGSDERLATDMSIYFPRFVRVSLSSR